MIRQSFNTGWEIVSIQNNMGIKQLDGQHIVLPYDCMQHSKRSADAPAQSHTGYYPNQVCTLAKRLVVPCDWSERHVVLEFEGVYTNSMVYVNGDYAGGCPNGYTNFLVELDDYLKYGEENEIKVVAKTNVDSRWYTGAGIYRDVNLMVGNLVYILPYGHQIMATDIETDSATAIVTTKLKNLSYATHTLRVETRLLNSEGKEVAQGSEVVTMFAGADEVLRQRLFILQPQLWEMDSPHLYTAQTCLYEGEEKLDEACSTFGVRRLALDVEHGLRINGKKVKLRGACVHHDNGVIGAATIARAEERRVQLLKQAGFNAVRSAHNPISRAFLEACDREGILVMDELSDIWTRSKTEYDYSTTFSYHWKQDVEAMVNKDYNHPLVIMYSIGNEIPENGSPHGARIGRQLAEAFRALDPTRYTINSVSLMMVVMDKFVSAVGFEQGDVEDSEINEIMTIAGPRMAEITKSELVSNSTAEVFGAVDIAGYNYATERYLLDRELYPNRVLCGSETFPKQIAQNWEIVKKNSHVIGDFTWTGWDYIGEAGLGRVRYAEDSEQSFFGEYPWYISCCSDLDITGHRRPVSYFREIVFGLRSEPYIAVSYPWVEGKTFVPVLWSFFDGISSWTWPGYENKSIVVEVYAPGDRVELWCNGRKLGEAALDGYKATVRTTYQPGELVAIAYEKDKELGRTSLRTAGETLRLRVEADRSEIQSSDRDLAYLSIWLEDEMGIVNNMADRKVSVTVSGACELLGLGSANPKSEEDFRAGCYTTFDGHALAVLRPREAGIAKVLVEAEGCEPQKISIKVV